MSLPALVHALTNLEEQPVGSMPFQDVLECVHVTRYTGAVIMHFLDGKPKAVEVAKVLTWKLS